MRTLAVSDNYIFAGTWGDGVFRAKLSDFVTSVNYDYSLNDAIKIHPNPARDYIEIYLEYPPLEGDERGRSEIKIYNTLSESVMSTSVPINRDTSASGGEVRVDVSNLPAGVYYVRFGSVGKMFVKI